MREAYTYTRRIPAPLLGCKRCVYGNPGVVPPATFLNGSAVQTTLRGYFLTGIAVNPNISHRGGESACSSREKLRCSSVTGCSNLFPSRRLAFHSNPGASSPLRCETCGLSNFFRLLAVLPGRISFGHGTPGACLGRSSCVPVGKPRNRVAWAEVLESGLPPY